MRARDVLTIAREYGPAWMAWRGGYEALLRSGAMHALHRPVAARDALAAAWNIPSHEVPARAAAGWRDSRGRLFFDIDELRKRSADAADAQAVREAKDVVAGSLLFWRRHLRDVGNPPDWFQGERLRWPADVHWSDLPDLSQEYGDIKMVWEPARFTHTYALARAWLSTADETYPETFWRHVEDFVEKNPPECGPHARCGQEMSIRVLAWTFGLFAFRDSVATTPERVGGLLEAVWSHARHIERVHWYASRCVRNNHALTEAAALLTVGAAFPFLPRSERWRSHGLAALAQEAEWQVYEDGAYVQSSTNYARLAGQVLTWGLQVARANDLPVPEVLPDRARRLARFLYSLQEGDTGRLPNYGMNDGALLFPLSSCGYLDYRPAVAALARAGGLASPYPAGSWDEESLWFGLQEEPPGRPSLPEQGSERFPVGGYHVLRGISTFGTIRCANFRHRPGQPDQLHLDVWYGATNILIDAGTYSYNAPPPWRGHFEATATHNTVTVDGRDQMRRGPKFLWIGWPRGAVRAFSTETGVALFDGEHHGYAPVVHRRRVVLRDEAWCIIDDMTGGEEGTAHRLHWLVGDLPLVPRDDGGLLTLPGGRPLDLLVVGGEGDWVRGDERTPRGFQSLHYQERTPAWSFAWIRRGPSARFVTLLGPAEAVSRFRGASAAEVATAFGLGADA